MPNHRFLHPSQVLQTFLAGFALAAIAVGLASIAHAQTVTEIALTNVTYAGMVFDSAGNLYGVTYTGGSSTNCPGFGGCGAVFELSPAGGTTWTQTTIYNFQNLADGSLPFGGLVFDAAGNLYGTNTGGGTYNAGVAFELSPASGGSWTFTPLYSFGQSKQSVPPGSPLTLDAAGNLYGITLGGGRYSYGSAFKLSNVAGVWKEQILHSFGGPGDGIQPYGSLVIDAHGNLYGTTSAGGSTSGGVVFELSPHPSQAWTEQLLYTFPTFGSPEAGLIFDSAHNLYGTSLGGGAHGFGGVFRLTRINRNGSLVWKYIQLYSFTNGTDGSSPVSPLTFDASGNLYGTDAAPETNCSDPFDGCWQGYKLSVGANGLWQIAALYQIPADGNPANGGLVLDSFGDIFGTAYDSSVDFGAAVYEVTQ
jgi:uncharacterized repeat protein (TIGR03803 family)